MNCAPHAAQSQLMLMPQFSIRATLAFVTAAAFVFVVAGFAYRGQDWAWGVVIALVSLGVTALVHGAWFGVVWMFAQIPSPNAVATVPSSAATGNADASQPVTGNVTSENRSEGSA
jgi:ABC-type uncharacterized transport system permease subunit